MFISTLSINEFVLSDGIQVRGMVYGSVVYNSREQAATGSSQTLKSATRSQTRILTTAIERLQENAAQLKATGVIAVKIRHQPLQKNIWEYTLTGTAIAENDLKSSRKPFICTLSGQEFLLLRAGGYRPVGLAFGVCVYSQIAHERVERKVAQRINTERSDFTHGLYTARKNAFAALHQKSVALTAEGVLAIKVTMERTRHRDFGMSERMLIKLTAIGTAVVSCPSHDLTEVLTINPVVLTNV